MVTALYFSVHKIIITMNSSTFGLLNLFEKHATDTGISHPLYLRCSTRHDMSYMYMYIVMLQVTMYMYTLWLNA